MAATFRTPGRRTPADTHTHNVASPSLIPRAPQAGPSTPTGATSDIASAVSGTTDSRKRQTKKDEVTPLSPRLIRPFDVNWRTN